MLKIFNTLTKSQEEFRPLNPPNVSFYQCGPTVYWIQHLGNMRAMVLADLIRRSLSYLGYRVKFARNYTDVGHLVSDEDEGEDKIAKTAEREKLSAEEVANKYIAQFEADVRSLNCLEPDYNPRATEYIRQMQAMVQTLLDKGFAYATDLAIYFDISKAKDYTRLSGQKLEMNQAEAGKGEIGDSGKKNPADFSIWFFKAGAHQNALQSWEHEFSLPDGRKISSQGFPGWHLECSAMNLAIFGPAIDLHMGGIEHIPVHHTNEIAQSEAANGTQFVKYWLHNEHLNVSGGKMSKSAGTAYAVADLIKQGYDPLVLRYFFLGSHYRSQQNFTWEALSGAKSALDNLRSAVIGIKTARPSKSLLSFLTKPKVNLELKQKFISALEDDFNLPQALSIVWETLKSELSPAEKYATIIDFDRVLGLNLSQIKLEEVPQEVKILAEARFKARQDKNWQESDRLRNELSKVGWQMDDGRDDYKLKKI